MESGKRKKNSRNLFIDLFFKGLNGKMISSESESGNATDAGRRRDEGMSERFPLKNVGEVNFDAWPIYDAKGIRQGNTGVGQATGIDNPPLDLPSMLVQEIYQFAFVITLKKAKLMLRESANQFIFKIN